MTVDSANGVLYRALAYAGALPFLACGVLPHAGVPIPAFLGDYSVVAASYALAIVSFLAGVHWGAYLYFSAQSPLNLLVTSNVVTVAAWIAFVLGGANVSLAVSALGFVTLLSIDYRLERSGLLAPAYLRTRRNVTVLVVASIVSVTAS